MNRSSFADRHASANPLQLGNALDVATGASSEAMAAVPGVADGRDLTRVSMGNAMHDLLTGLARETLPRVRITGQFCHEF